MVCTRLLWSLLLLLWVVPMVASATPLRICSDELPHPPYLFPGGQGTTGLLIRMAAADIGLALTFYDAPVRRCREDLRANEADAFPVTPYDPETLPFVAFPMADGKIDRTRATTSVRTIVVRRIGSPAHWDGKLMTGLQKPVLVKFGTIQTAKKLKAMQVAVDDTGKSPPSNFRKLVAGRGDLAICPEVEGQLLLRQPEFAGKLEALPTPFTDDVYYLAITQQFDERYPGLAEQLWNAIARTKQSPAYLKAIGASVVPATRKARQD
jgi:polar amino acid transport system substrate-binding protein